MVDIIAIDGPSGCGKGTISQMLARHLSYHLLDSGALYRIVAFASLKKGLNEESESLYAMIDAMDVQFVPGGRGEPADVLLDGQDISAAIRTSACAKAASKVATYQGVRRHLLAVQHAFAKEPGLVADGRDMGTVVFPEARYKVYLDAQPGVRAQRRFNQLKQAGFMGTIREVEEDLQQRDRRDKEREHSPLRPADDAVVVDTSHLSIEDVFEQVTTLIRA